jgi:hypothetical protein
MQIGVSKLLDRVREWLEREKFSPIIRSAGLVEMAFTGTTRLESNSHGNRAMVKSSTNEQCSTKCIVPFGVEK